MQVTKIFTGEDGKSHFAVIDIPLTDGGEIGRLSAFIPTSGLVLRETGAEYDYTWHNAPRRQFVFMLKGGVEIEVGDGEVRRLLPGEVLLVEDTTGQGHRSRSIDHQARVSAFVTLD